MMNVFVGVIKMRRKINMEMKQARDKFKSLIEFSYNKESPSYFAERILGLPLDTILVIYFQIEKYLNLKNIKRRYKNG